MLPNKKVGGERKEWNVGDERKASVKLDGAYQHVFFRFGVFLEKKWLTQDLQKQIKLRVI